MGSDVGDIALTLGLGAIGAGIVQGERAKSAQKEAIRRQDAAQREATNRATAEQRRQEMERRRLNKKTPNVAGILKREQGASTSGVGSTVLTGAAGVSPGRLMLGRSSMLGSG